MGQPGTLRCATEQSGNRATPRHATTPEVKKPLPMERHGNVMSAHAGPTDMLSEVQDIELHAMKEGGAILLERVQEDCTLVLLNCVENCLLIGLMNDIYVADICWRVSCAILSESRFAHSL
jgi:hypothetical protein